MAQITYTKAGLDDVGQLVNIRTNFLIELRGQQPEAEVQTLKQNLEKYFANAIKNQTYHCWMAKSDNKIVGIGGMAIRESPGNFLNMDGKQGYIMNMYTDPEYRKQGIGSVILMKLMESGKAIGIKSFELHATEMGEPIYKRFGFKLHSEPTYRMWE